MIKIPELNKDEVLSALGLQVKPSIGASVVGAALVFCGGLLVGATAAFLLAPKSGRDLRTDIARKMRRTPMGHERAEDTAYAAGAEV